MQELTQNPAVIGGLAGAAVVALSNLIRAIYTLYLAKRRRTLEPRLSLTLSPVVELHNQSGIVLCNLLVENVGEVKAVLEYASLKVRLPLLQQGPEGGWMQQLQWGEPEDFEALEPGDLPGKVLNPGERYQAPGALRLSSQAPQPLQIAFRVVAAGDYYWATIATTRVADSGLRHDNESEERRR